MCEWVEWKTSVYVYVFRCVVRSWAVRNDTRVFLKGNECVVFVEAFEKIISSDFEKGIESPLESFKRHLHR